MTFRTPVLHLIGDSLTDTDNITDSTQRYDAQTAANFPMFTVNSALHFAACSVIVRPAKPVGAVRGRSRK